MGKILLGETQQKKTKYENIVHCCIRYNVDKSH